MRDARMIDSAAPTAAAPLERRRAQRSREMREANR
jgi:hypothetical protein